MRYVIQHIHWLIHRIREQARSHIFTVPTLRTLLFQIYR